MVAATVGGGGAAVVATAVALLVAGVVADVSATVGEVGSATGSPPPPEITTKRTTTIATTAAHTPAMRSRLRLFRGALGAWVTFTDTSDFVAEYNQGYEDKGIYITFPLSIFFDSDIAGSLSYLLRPWTRDPGATVDLTVVNPTPTASAISSSINPPKYRHSSTSL